MGTDTPSEQNPWQSPHGAPPAPQRSYAAPASSASTPGWQPQPMHGPPGQVRPTVKAILLFLVTLGLYTYVYNYKVHKEMKEHSGRGVGGAVALLLTFLTGIAMPFVTSSEVGALYARRGEREPVRGWTALWFLLGILLGYVLLFVGAFAVVGEAAVVVAVGLFAIAAVGGGVIWFVKTNGALNRYWESLPRG